MERADRRREAHCAATAPLALALECEEAELMGTVGERARDELLLPLGAALTKGVKAVALA